jgi:hypothetical protein
MQMKKTTLIVLLLFASCLLAVQGTWAETAGYEDSGRNPVTNNGVLGAKFTGDGNGNRKLTHRGNRNLTHPLVDNKFADAS